MADLSKELIAAINNLANVHDARFGEIAEALKEVALRVKYLGTGETIMRMGAIEFLATAVQEAGEAVSRSLAERD